MARLTGTMIRITAPHFVAAVDVEHAGLTGLVVTHAAPILRYMTGWHVQRVVGYCDAKRWTWERLDVWDPPIVP